MVLFEGFELLDVFGPVELFSRLPQEYEVSLIGPATGPVASSQGTQRIRRGITPRCGDGAGRAGYARLGA